MCSTTANDFRWEFFLDLANELETLTTLHSDEQAILRTCIGRAYYAAFGCAREFKRHSDISFSRCEQSFKNEIHEYVINQFSGQNDEVQSIIFRRLTDLRRDRNKADYNSRALVSHKDVEKAIRKSREIHSALAQLANKS